MSEYQRLQQELATGWNTWYTQSVLTHLWLPRGLMIKLGVKEYREGRYLREALIGRQGEGAEQVRPGIRSYDGFYTELFVTWQDIELHVESAVIGKDELIIQVNPLRNQLMPAVLIAECGIGWNGEGTVAHDAEHGFIEAVLPRERIRIYPATPLVEEYHVTTSGPYMAQRLSGTVGISVGKQRSISEIEELIANNRRLLEASRSKYGELREIYEAMQTCIAWDTIYDPKHCRVVTPVSRIWNDQGYKLFCWDTYFAAYMSMEDNRPLAYANAVEITRSALATGFVPNYDWSGINISRDRSQPPVGSTIILQLYRKYGDRWLLEEVFEQLCAWNEWWSRQRQIRPGWLAWGSDPIEPVTGNDWEYDGVHDTFGAALESGLDNSPVYDDVPFNKERNMLELADVGLTSLYIMDCLALAEIAEILGDTTRAGLLRSSADLFGGGLKRLWDEETGIFRNLHTDTGTFSKRLSPTNFYPLLTPYVTKQQVRRMIDEHLLNPEEFWGDWVIPTISRDDPAYVDQDYWRGRIWGPTNLLVYLGLRKQGERAIARAFADRSAALILKEWHSHGHVHENYNGDTGAGCDVLNSDRYYHWGGLLAFISLMEHGRVQAPF